MSKDRDNVPVNTEVHMGLMHEVLRSKTSKLKTALQFLAPFKVKGGDPAALSSTATLLRLHPPH